MVGARFILDDLLVDLDQHSVSRDGVVLDTTRKTFAVLRLLLLRAPAVVTHDELHAVIWVGQVVSPETIAQTVRLLRRALSDDAQKPRYIRGLRGVGYQLLPPVVPCAAPTDAAASPRSEARKLTAASAMDEGPRIAVLPIRYCGEHSPTNALAVGVTQELTARIGRARSFFVSARSSVAQLARQLQEPASIAQSLGARFVVEGTVIDSDGVQRLYLSLADTEARRELWSQSFDGPLRDLLSGQSDFFDQIVCEIEHQAGLAEQRRALTVPVTALTAWEAYHRGCYYMYHFSDSALTEAERWFQRSIELDPNGARAHACLSWTYWQRFFLSYVQEREKTLEYVFRHANRSLELGSDDPLAHWAMGRALLLRGDLTAAIGELTVSSDLNPSFAVGRYSLGFALMQDGRLDDAIDQADASIRLSPLDPLRFLMLGVQGFSLSLGGEYERGADLLDQACAQNNTHYQIFAKSVVASGLAGRRKTAAARLARVREAHPGYGVEDFLRSFAYRDPDIVEQIETGFARASEVSPAE